MQYSQLTFRQFADQQRVTEDCFADFMQFLDLIICRACWHINYSRPPFHHGSGHFMDLLSECKIPRTYFQKWVKDSEHGLVHGVCTAFFAWLSLPVVERHRRFQELQTIFEWETLEKLEQYVPDSERLVVTCLLHDVIKSATGEHAGHDQGLMAISDGFPAAAYHHSDPQPDDLMHPLVIGDRVELLRYPDWEQWVNREMVDPHVETCGKEIVHHFYRHIRPVLERAIIDQDALWVSHCPEVRWMKPIHVPLLRGPSYPASHWALEQGHYSVAMGRLPLDDHTCLSHYSQSYNWFTGMIPLKTLQSYGATVVANFAPKIRREHPFIKKGRDVPVREWTFTYSQIKDCDLLRYASLCLLKRNNFNRFYHAMRRIIDLVDVFAVEPATL